MSSVSEENLLSLEQAPVSGGRLWRGKVMFGRLRTFAGSELLQSLLVAEGELWDVSDVLVLVCSQGRRDVQRFLLPVVLPSSISTPS